MLRTWALQNHSSVAGPRAANTPQNFFAAYLFEYETQRHALISSKLGSARPSETVILELLASNAFRPWLVTCIGWKSPPTHLHPCRMPWPQTLQQPWHWQKYHLSTGSREAARATGHQQQLLSPLYIGKRANVQCCQGIAALQLTNCVMQLYLHLRQITQCTQSNRCQRQ